MKKVVREKTVTAQLRTNSAILFRVVRAHLSASSEDRVKDGDVGKLLGMGTSQTSHWKSGLSPLTCVIKLKVLSQATGLSLDFLHSIVSGEFIPDEYVALSRLREMRT